MTSAHPTRREVLRGMALLGAATALGGCAATARPAAGPTPGQTPAGRTATSTAPRVHTVTLRAGPTQVDMGGRTAATWAYNGAVPGPTIRVRAGDQLRARVVNELPSPTSVHWHGLAIDNAMDGVPGVTTPQVAAGGEFTYDFTVPDPGTHWFHPHHGLQLDRGLYAPLVVEAGDEPGDYDHEWILVLDDWTDGLGATPEQVLRDLRSSDPARPMGGMRGMHRASAGDVDYPLFLINGRPPNDPDVLRAKPGQRVRLRIVNAAADTIFDVAVPGTTLLVTHTDGYGVQPRTTALLRIGMGERYDATVTVPDGATSVVAAPLGKSGLARALVRGSTGDPAPADARPDELATQPLTVAALTAAPGTALPAQSPARTHPVVLAGPFPGYVWTINNQAYPDVDALPVQRGEAVRLSIANHSMMPHPMHLHGHTFQLGTAGGTGPRKDTVLVDPMTRLDVHLVADNPGDWLLHCHNAYHAEAGMMTRLDYQA